MPDENSSSVAWPDAFDWLASHPKGRVIVIGCCLWISVTLIVRMWIVARNASSLKKTLWSFVLLIPIFGWVFYWGCFRIPDYSNCPCPTGSSPV